MRRLQSTSDVRRYIAYLIDSIEAGKIKPEVAGRLGYLSNILLRATEQVWRENRLLDIEQRLDSLENLRDD